MNTELGTRDKVSVACLTSVKANDIIIPNLKRGKAEAAVDADCALLCVVFI